MIWVWGVFAVVGLTMSQNPVFRRFEYKHSFRAPNLAQRDGSIPFWMVCHFVKSSSKELLYCLK
ncbi:hypothetical protein COOONC_20430 [Cooperia oncophora]